MFTFHHKVAVQGDEKYLPKIESALKNCVTVAASSDLTLQWRGWEKPIKRYEIN